jgi:transcriptional regulator with XRE-family HTH domain
VRSAPELPLSDEAAIAKARAERLGLTQVQLASALGLKQSQVSRMLAGKITRRTAAFASLSAYLGAEERKDARRALSPELQDAILSVWDGSPEHASSLATVIRSLALLKSRASRNH